MLYRRVVEQSRRPCFYKDLGVPDSLDGRFGLIALHTVLLVRRLRLEGNDGRQLAQALFDMMFADMDGSLREMGVGDLGVGRRVKAMARAFFGSAAAYEAGLAGNEAELGDALRRNLFGTVEARSEALSLMVRYVRRQAQALNDEPGSEVLQGRVVFAVRPEKP